MAGVESALERKDGEHAADISLDRLDAPLFPRPDLGRDIVEHGNAGLGRGLGHLEIERGIVDEYQAVGPALEQLPPRRREVREYLAEMAEHLAEAHESHVAVVDYRGDGGRGRHPVAAEKGETRVAVGLAQSLDQSSSVKVARGLACYYKIVHIGLGCYLSLRRPRKKSRISSRHSSAQTPRVTAARGWKG